MNAEPNQNRVRKLLNKLVLWHRAVAILLLNTVILFVGVNVVLFVAFWVKDNLTSVASPSLVYPEKSLAAVYPEFTRQEWKKMMDECWTRPYVYENYVLFKERPYQGRYVNVTEAGFRKIKEQGPWPPDPKNFNLFVFGGSTMFGYGVADDQTFASYLQEQLAPECKKRLCVYNFGCGYYYSTQERILLERLLSQGYKPDLAIFVDGLNDLWRVGDEPGFSENVKTAFGKSPFSALVGKLPMMRLFGKIQKETSTPINSAQVGNQLLPVLERYQANMKMIEALGRSFGFKPLFVWQPVPSYKYDTKYHLFYSAPKTYQNQAAGYPEMERLYKEHRLTSNFVWCADLQADEKECLYVDGHHYTARFGKKFAEAVGRACVERGLMTNAMSDMNAMSERERDAVAKSRE